MLDPCCSHALVRDRSSAPKGAWEMIGYLITLQFFIAPCFHRLDIHDLVDHVVAISQINKIMTSVLSPGYFTSESIVLEQLDRTTMSMALGETCKYSQKIFVVLMFVTLMATLAVLHVLQQAYVGSSRTNYLDERLSNTTPRNLIPK
jgi:hypothetical protein